MILQGPKDSHEENCFTQCGGVIDPVPVLDVKDGVLAPANNNKMLTAATQAHENPNLTIGQVHQSIIAMLPQHNKHVTGSRPISKSIAAAHAIVSGTAFWNLFLYLHNTSPFSISSLARARP
jgi:hypothetical protein